jgi:hypothetical protein
MVGTTIPISVMGPSFVRIPKSILPRCPEQASLLLALGY